MVSAGAKGKSEVLVHGYSERQVPTPSFTCQGKTLPITDSYKYLGQLISVTPDLLYQLALTQIKKATGAYQQLRAVARQLHIRSPQVRTLLA